MSDSALDIIVANTNSRPIVQNSNGFHGLASVRPGSPDVLPAPDGVVRFHGVDPSSVVDIEEDEARLSAQDSPGGRVRGLVVGVGVGSDGENVAVEDDSQVEDCETGDFGPGLVGSGGSVDFMVLADGVGSGVFGARLNVSELAVGGRRVELGHSGVIVAGVLKPVLDGDRPDGLIVLRDPHGHEVPIPGASGSHPLGAAEAGDQPGPAARTDRPAVPTVAVGVPLDVVVDSHAELVLVGLLPGAGDCVPGPGVVVPVDGPDVAVSTSDLGSRDCGGGGGRARVDAVAAGDDLLEVGDLGVEETLEAAEGAQPGDLGVALGEQVDHRLDRRAVHLLGRDHKLHKARVDSHGGRFGVEASHGRDGDESDEEDDI